MAVRIRPLSSREIVETAQTCVAITDTGSTIELKANQVQKEVLKFTFDHCSWAYNNSQSNEKDHSLPISDIIDQNKFVDSRSQIILDEAWQGYNSTTLAYGQTGAGKTSLMRGSKTSRGIISGVIWKIFKRIEADTCSSNKYHVSLSMVELYGDRLKDLLATPFKSDTDLPVREHPKLGVYIEGLSNHLVTSVDQTETLIEQGYHSKMISETLLSHPSSKKQVIIAINLLQRQDIGGRLTEKLSVVRLVELAGSEKASLTMLTGNQTTHSLTALSRVVCSLSLIKPNGKKVHVPHRDSKLTRILQDIWQQQTSRVHLLCVISPADSNYDETLSTLKFAERVSKIRSTTVVEWSEKDEILRELKEENDKLKGTLQNLVVEAAGPITGQLQESFKQAEVKLKAQSHLMEEIERYYEQSRVAKTNYISTDGKLKLLQCMVNLHARKCFFERRREDRL